MTVTRDNRDISRDPSQGCHAVSHTYPSRPDPTRPICSYQGWSFCTGNPVPVRHLGDVATLRTAGAGK